MTGGLFLVGLREVINSKRILSAMALIKMNISFLKECLTADKDIAKGKK